MTIWRHLLTWLIAAVLAPRPHRIERPLVFGDWNHEPDAALVYDLDAGLCYQEGDLGEAVRAALWVAMDTGSRLTDCEYGKAEADKIRRELSEYRRKDYERWISGRSQ